MVVRARALSRVGTKMAALFLAFFPFYLSYPVSIFVFIATGPILAVTDRPLGGIERLPVSILSIVPCRISVLSTWQYRTIELLGMLQRITIRRYKKLSQREKMVLHNLLPYILIPPSAWHVWRHCKFVYTIAYISFVRRGRYNIFER